jgi:hypothetical protein
VRARDEGEDEVRVAAVGVPCQTLEVAREVGVLLALLHANLLLVASAVVGDAAVA